MEEGSEIFIDNINIKEIPINILRKHISVIPQVPFLFSGSIRQNLDPFQEVSEEILRYAIQKAGLEHIFGELTLDSELDKSKYSYGVKQLICFARVLIRKNKIIILDEATSNVDPATDTFIQQYIYIYIYNLILREMINNFGANTVLTIAHRIDTVVNSDKILVIDSG